MKTWKAAGQVASSLTAHSASGDSSGVDSSVMEVGEAGERESAKEQKSPLGTVRSDSTKHVSFVPQQLCTVQGVCVCVCMCVCVCLHVLCVW